MPSTQYEPTVAAPPFYDPNVASQSYNSGSSGQAFSSPANAAPAQPGYNDYNRSPANPYTPEVPSSYSPQSGYGTPPPPPNAFNPQSAYGAPPPNMYGAPYAPAPGGMLPQGQPMRRKGPNVGLIIGIAVLLVLVIAGGVLALKGHTGGQGNTGATTPSTNQTPGPSGSPIDSSVASIITNAQTTSSIDSNYLPTHVTNQFKVGDVVYVTFHLNLTQSGYVEAKVYEDGIFGTQTSLPVTVGKYDHGYFNITYQKASKGAFELYWCLQKDCSDAKLAAVATFTVS